MVFVAVRPKVAALMAGSHQSCSLGFLLVLVLVLLLFLLLWQQPRHVAHCSLGGISSGAGNLQAELVNMLYVNILTT